VAIDALYLPELPLKIGGFLTVFRNAPALLRSTVAATKLALLLARDGPAESGRRSDARFPGDAD
jgi:hypothetical protein